MCVQKSSTCQIFSDTLPQEDNEVLMPEIQKNRVDLVSEIKGEHVEKRTPILKKFGPCNLAWLQWTFTEEYKANLLEATFLIKFHLIGPVEWIILTGAIGSIKELSFKCGHLQMLYS